MARDRLTVCKQELLQAFARLVSISSNFLLDLESKTMDQYSKPDLHQNPSGWSFGHSLSVAKIVFFKYVHNKRTNKQTNKKMAITYFIIQTKLQLNVTSTTVIW